MNSEYNVINVFKTSNETELKSRVNNTVRTLCTEDIEKLMNSYYNISVAYWDGTSDFTEKEVSEQC